MEDSSNQEYLYRSIGKIVVAFQLLERSIEQLIFSCTTSSYEQTRLLMNELSFKSKTHIMKSMIKDLHSQEEELHNGWNIHETIDNIFKECNRSEQIRNQKVHSFWIPEFKSAPNSVMRMKENSKKEKENRLSAELVEAGSLDEEINIIEDCQKKLSEFTMKLSCDYQRLHGIPGLSNIVTHEEVSEFLQQNFMNKNSSKGS